MNRSATIAAVAADRSHDGRVNECRHDLHAVGANQEYVGITGSGCNDVDDASTPTRAEIDGASGQRKEGVVTAPADILAWVKMGPTLPDDDLASRNNLATEPLDTQPLGV